MQNPEGENNITLLRDTDLWSCIGKLKIIKCQSVQIKSQLGYKGRVNDYEGH